MKTWERLLLDNPPFYPDSSTDEEKMRFMFLLEDGRLVGDSEGRNHRDLMGWTTEDGDSNQIEQNLCKQNKALRVCFQPFSLKQDGTRGEFWTVYVEINKIVPNEAQWATLSKLYLMNGYRNTFVDWDAYLPEKKKWNHKSEGTLAELRELLYPAAQTVKTKKTRQSKRSPVRNR